MRPPATLKFENDPSYKAFILKVTKQPWNERNTERCQPELATV